jgi:hypothetical protein
MNSTQEACWLHYKFGEPCSECQELNKAIKDSLEATDEPEKKEYEVGSNSWDVVKTLLWLNLFLWISMLTGSILLSR